MTKDGIAVDLGTIMKYLPLKDGFKQVNEITKCEENVKAKSLCKYLHRRGSVLHCLNSISRKYN